MKKYLCLSAADVHGNIIQYEKIKYLVVAEVVYQRSDPTYWHWRDISEMGITTNDRMTQIKTDVVKFRTKTQF